MMTNNVSIKIERHDIAIHPTVILKRKLVNTTISLITWAN